MWDNIGCYFYEAGYCLRDAFRRALGDGHPIIWEIPYRCTTAYLSLICERYGFVYGRGRLDARIGQKIIWIVSQDDDTPEGHATFCTDPRRIAQAQEDGDILVSGYILLEE